MPNWSVCAVRALSPKTSASQKLAAYREMHDYLRTLHVNHLARFSSDERIIPQYHGVIDSHCRGTCVSCRSIDNKWEPPGFSAWEWLERERYFTYDRGRQQRDEYHEMNIDVAERILGLVEAALEGLKNLHVCLKWTSWRGKKALVRDFEGLKETLDLDIESEREILSERMRGWYSW